MGDMDGDRREGYVNCGWRQSGECMLKERDEER